MDINLKYLNDISVLSINTEDTVYKLKELIADKYIYPNIDSIRLIYNGLILDNKKKINEYNLDLNKIIHIVLPYHKHNLNDDSDLESIEDVDFSENNNENSLFNLDGYQSSGFNQMLFTNILNQLNANNTSNIQFDFQFDNNQENISSQESSITNNNENHESNESNMLQSDDDDDDTLQSIHNDNDENNNENSEQSNNNQIDSSTNSQNSQNYPNNLNNTEQINNIQNQMNTLLQNMMNNSTILNNYNTNMYQEEITTLNEMGFNDNNLNRMVLNQTNGNLELAIEILFNY